MDKINTGLEGVVVAETRLSMVDGERGELIIGGYRVEELAASATFEETVWLLWHGELPDAVQLASFRADLASRRELPAETLELLAACAGRNVEPMDALRIAAGTLSMGGGEGADIVARFATIVAAYARLRSGREPLPPRRDLRHAANYLYMLSGEEPSEERVRGMETYLNTVMDHGLNASTFTARVITSTGSDLVSAVVGAVGALKGPLHGGAPGPVLDMFDSIGAPDHAEAWLLGELAAGRRI
ncbi:MAG TPA: citrate/2-methylcitrate synthase, partial [Thermoanaerobaculia bacterium]|nr:citrate/2-methylcitrate synthase [Thermoanaerobaculia bacterium]